jgi:hypothetical protein
MACGTFGADQRFDVCLILDLLALAIDAPVLGDHHGGIEHTHGGQRGHDRYILAFVYSIRFFIKL